MRCGLSICALVFLSLHALASGAEPLVVFDLAHTARVDTRNAAQRRRAWDEQHLVAALQGLVNRERPRLYVLFAGEPDGRIDRYWLEKLTASGQWWADRPIMRQDDLSALLKQFEKSYRGVVVYDERVAATALVASTVAGADDLLPVRFDPDAGSIYHRLVLDPHGPRMKVIVRLTNEDGSPIFTGKVSGSAKCDATLWAIEHYLKSGKCDATKLAMYPDGYWLAGKTDVPAARTLLANHDYFIARRGFFFDLHVWEDEAPIDNPAQPPGADLRTLQTVMHAAYEQARGQMIHVAGFTPWDQKYTTHTGQKHEGVPTEWRLVEILSCFDAFTDGDAPALHAMANASAFQHFPLRDRYPQTNLPTEDDLRRRGFLNRDGKVVAGNYLSIYAGDYDSAAWLYQVMPGMWNDPNRGSVPLGWAMNPSNAERFPVGLHFARETATANDTFVAGDSGFGYLNPGNLVGERKWSGLPSGLPAWEKLCAQAFGRWDLRITAFVIDGFSPEMDDQVKAAYARFSPGGIVEQGKRKPALIAGAPYLGMWKDLNDPRQGAETIAGLFERDTGGQAHFELARTILWTPTQHGEMFDRLARQRPDIKVVEPHALMMLLKRSLETGREPQSP